MYANKVGHDYPLSKLVSPHGRQPSGFGEGFKMVFTIYWCGCHQCHVTMTIWGKIRSTYPKESPYEI